MKHVSAIFMLIAFITGCKKDAVIQVNCTEKVNQIEQVKQLIAGTYNWTHTTVHMRGSAPFTETPASTGRHYKYIFYTNGTVDYVENNVLKSTDNYTVDYEFKVSTSAADSATIVIIKDKITGQRKGFFRPWLCNDSARFYNPFNSIETHRYFKRN